MPTALPLLPASELTYRCPGQRGAVSEAVHNARLEADFPACRGCEHGRKDRRPALEFEAGNLRGRGGNVIDRAAVAGWARALAAGLSERCGGRPRVVVGYDGRPSSPDLFAGLRALSDAGCELLDIGRSLRPVLDFAVRELTADAGVFVTGGTAANGWNGLDVVGPGAAAWSWPGTAADLMTGRSDRPRRGGGRRTPVRPHSAYAAAFLSRTHDVRPLRVVCYTRGRLAGRLAETILGATACRAEVRAADESPLADRLRRRVGAEGLSSGGRFDAAFEVRADGRAAAVADETGTVLSEAAVAAVLAGGREVVALGETTEEEADLHLRAGRAAFGVADSPAVVEGSRVLRDGFHVMSLVLRRLSNGEESLSRRVRAAGLERGRVVR